MASSTLTAESGTSISGRIPTWTAWVLVGFTALAAALRIAGLAESFFGDELFTYEVSGRASPGDVLAGVQSDLEITPPLFFLTAWLFGTLGDPFVWLRMVSVLSSIATVPLLYLLGRRTVGWAAGLVAAGFWALSPMTIVYGVEARSYAMLSMFVVLATLSMLRAVRSRRWQWWVAVTLTFAACMYTNYTCVFVLLALAGWALVTHRDQWRPWLLAMGASALLFVPWLPSMADDLAAPNQTVYNALLPFSSTVLVEETLRAMIQGPYAPISWLPVALIGAAALIAIIGMVLHRGPLIQHTPAPILWLIVLLALATPLGLILQSLVGNDMYSARNLTASLPAAYLLLAALLVALPRRWSTVGLALAFAGFAMGAVRTLDADTARPDYRQAGAYITQQARPGDTLLEVIPFAGPPSEALRVHVDPSVRYQKVDTPERVATTMARRPGRYFLAFGDQPPPAIPGYRVVTTESWPGMGRIRVALYEPAD